MSGIASGMTSFKPFSRTVLPLSAAAVTIGLIAGCGNGDDGTETTDTEMTTTPTTTAEVTTTAPAEETGPAVEPITPQETVNEAPVQTAPPTTRENGSGMPGQTTSVAPSAEPPVISTPSPPTGDTLPGENAPPQGDPGTPGRN